MLGDSEPWTNIDQKHGIKAASGRRPGLNWNRFRRPFHPDYICGEVWTEDSQKCSGLLLHLPSCRHSSVTSAGAGTTVVPASIMAAGPPHL